MLTKEEIHEKLSKLTDISYQGKAYETDKKIMIAASHDMLAGGAPIVLLSLLRFLDSEYDCFLIAPNDGEMTSRFVDSGIGVYIAEPQVFDCECFKDILQQADLYLCNTIVSSYFVSLAYQMNTPTVWWIHEDMEYFNYYEQYLSVEKCTSSNIRIVAVAERARQSVEEKFHVKCGLLHLGIEDEFNQRRRRQAAEPVTFFMPGNFISMKGHDIMVQAIRKLPAEYLRRTKFIFAGRRDSKEAYIYEMVQKLSEEYVNVDLIGCIGRDEVYALDQAVDCVVAPSRIDTLPTTIIEGMMMKAINICSDNAGISYYIDHGKSGFVFKNENVDELAELIQYVADHICELDEVRENGRQVYLDNFTDQICVNQIHNLLEEMESQKKNFAKRVIIFCGEIDILDIFSYQLRDAFVSMSYEVLIFDVKNQLESMVKLLKFLMYPVTAMISFNSIGIKLELEKGVNFWEQWNIPCVNILMDHPFCYHEEMLEMTRNGAVLCVDKNHMNYLARFYPNISIYGYLPHGGIEKSQSKKRIEERSIDVLYVGGLSRDSAYKVMPDFSKYTEFDAKQLCRNAYDILIVETERTLEDVVEQLLKEQGLVYEDELLREIIADLHVIDLYVVSYFREKVIRVLAEAGVQIELYGYGWENCKWIETSSVKYGGRISAYDAVEKMKDAKIVLSTMTWFKDGTHDRIFNGMLQGAVTVSDSSVYMKEEFDGNMVDMLLFELDEIEQLPEKIAYILDNPQKAQQIADRGYAKAALKHTWLSRAIEMEQDLFEPLGWGRLD